MPKTNDRIMAWQVAGWGEPMIKTSFCRRRRAERGVGVRRPCPVRTQGTPVIQWTERNVTLSEKAVRKRFKLFVWNTC